jgi:hypothetical protein
MAALDDDRDAPLFEGVVHTRVLAPHAEPRLLDATVRLLHGWRVR